MGAVVAVVAVAAALAYAGLLAATRPFTPDADVLTAVGLAAGVAGLAVRLAAGRTRPAGPGAGGGPGRPAPAGPASPAAPAGPAGPDAAGGRRGTLLPWVVLLALVVGWELYCYAAGPRFAHPTLSSIEDLAARTAWLKALVVLGWLWLGWELVRR